MPTPEMLATYVRIALRSFRRRPGYTTITVFGLALGLACCVLIGLYVQQELSYDRFHEKGDRLYRLVSDVASSQQPGVQQISTVGWPYGRILRDEYPEVEEVVYLRSWPRLLVRHDDRYFEETLRWAEPGFFEAFSFPLVAGDPSTALVEPYSVVLTRSTAAKYFPEGEALGQAITLGDSLQFTVTGVAEDVPPHSHLQFDGLLSFSTYVAWNPRFAEDTGWFDLNMLNYVLLREGVDARAFERKIAGLAMERAGDLFERFGYTLTFVLEPVGDVYLRSDHGNVVGPTSDVDYVYLLAAIALVILVLACINFMNLATARAAERAKEVGVRKVVGSSRAGLVRRFLSESLLLALLGLVAGLGLASLALPHFNALAERTLRLAELATPGAAVALVVLLAGVGLAAGLYPAFVLSGFRPIEVLKGRFAGSPRGARLRQVLVVVQFAASIVLIVSTLVVVRQLQHMQSRDLGFEAEQVLVMSASRTGGVGAAERQATIKQRLLAHPAVEVVSAAHSIPGLSGWRGQVAYRADRSPEEGLSTEYIAVDADYAEALGLEVVAGRDFDDAFSSDEQNAILINEAAVRAFGWPSNEAAVGERIDSPSGFPRGQVVGVVRDYHQHGLHEAVGPIVLDVNPGATSLFALRYQAAATEAVVEHLEAVWADFFPGYDPNYFFADEVFARQYDGERRLGRIFATFAGLAVLIACLGLFGLAAYATSQRTKEIGVRKVLGASVPGLVLLLSRSFARLVGVSVVVAVPVAYLLMDRWLDGFAYQTDLAWWLFGVAGLAALLIALLTVAWQAIRAALADPVDSLRYE